MAQKRTAPMFKALLKKQLLELLNNNRRKRQSGLTPKSLIGTIVLYIALFVLLCASFFSLATLFGMEFLRGDVIDVERGSYLYFTLMGFITIFFGTVGGIFTVYTNLYKAGDNDDLLSLPIPTGIIITARLLSICLLNLYFCAVVWIPSAAAYFIIRDLSPVEILTGSIIQLLLLMAIGMLTVGIACILGFFVALLSRKIPFKNFFVLLFSLAGFGLYYYIMFRLSSVVNRLVANSIAIEKKLITWGYFIYLLGKGACGDILSGIAFIAIVGVFFAIVFIVLSKTFFKLTTSNEGERRIEYKRQTIKERGLFLTLIYKELKRFVNSPVIMLNQGFGIFIMPIMAVAAVIKMDYIRTSLSAISGLPGIDKFILALPVVLAFGLCSTIALNTISASSISLEGQNIWILQSLPVDTLDILRAKETAHTLLNTVPAVIAAAAIGFVTEFSLEETGAVMLIVVVFSRFTGVLGMTLNLIRPSLDWVSETAPVKSSIPVFIMSFLGMLFCVGLGALYIFILSWFMEAAEYLLICMAAFVLIGIILERWVRTRGVAIFRALN